MSFDLENLSGWDTGDLRRFLERGFRAYGFPAEAIRRYKIVAVAAPQRSRGCAEVGGRGMAIAMASPSHFSLRRLARLFEHEAAHLAGYEHEDMPHRLLYSLGGVPDWAQGTRLRYHGRAPNQMDRLSLGYKPRDRRAHQQRWSLSCPNGRCGG